MKKILTAALISVALVATSSTAFAADAKTTTKSAVAKPATVAKEGTVAHETTEPKAAKTSEKAMVKKAKTTKVKVHTPTTKKAPANKN